MPKEFKVDTTELSFIIEGSTGTFVIEVITTGEKEFESENEDTGIADFEHAIAEGDTVKVVLEIDPDKTDYDQTPVEVSATL